MAKAGGATAATSVIEPVAPPAGAPPLSLEAIVKRWPGSPPILEGVDLELQRGAAIAISGPNGSGKTTLLRIASGLIDPDSGVVRVCGRRPDDDRTAFQRDVGFVSAGSTGLYARLKAEHHLDLWA